MQWKFLKAIKILTTDIVKKVSQAIWREPGREFIKIDEKPLQKNLRCHTNPKYNNTHTHTNPHQGMLNKIIEKR